MISAFDYLYGAQFPADFQFCLFISRPTFILFSSSAHVLLLLILSVFELGLSPSYKDAPFSLVVRKCGKEDFELISSIQHFRAWLSMFFTELANAQIASAKRFFICVIQCKIHMECEAAALTLFDTQHMYELSVKMT